MTPKLLEIQNLTKEFGSKKQKNIAVNRATLELCGEPASTLAIVGESGSGKSTLANIILGFHKPTSGKVLYCGQDIAHLRGSGYKKYRHEVQAIFQNPFDAYNPFYTVDHVFDQVFRHFDIASTKQEQRALIEEKLAQVKLDAGNVLGKYSYQMSGGQLQRLMIARALLLTPKLLIADEPVSMVDASLRITVLDVMMRLKQNHGISQLYITHDLSTALQISDDIIVMYKGCIVEAGNAERVITNPAHPYTKLLISCIPIASPEEKWTETLAVGEGRDVKKYPDACCFCDRCPDMGEQCLQKKPGETKLEANHSVSCYLYGGAL